MNNAKQLVLFAIRLIMFLKRIFFRVIHPVSRMLRQQSIKESLSKVIFRNFGTPVCCNPLEAGGILLDSKDGISACQSPRVYGLCESFSYSQHYGPVHFCKFEKAVVSSSTDIVRLEKTSYWYKLRHPAFGNMVPLDKDLLAFNGLDSIFLRDIEAKQINRRSVFSLLGVHDSVWAHFLVQYFPKMQYLHQTLKISPDIVVLAPEALDGHAKIMLADFMAEIGIADRLEYVDNRTSVICEELFWVDHTSWLFDHAESFSTLAIVVPKDVIHFLSTRFDKIVAASICDNSNERIYLRRGGLRTTKNIQEIDDLLFAHGFKVIDPGKLSLPEKKAVFSQAKVIVGQLGSAFTNVLMCKQGARVIVLTNSDRLLDHYLPAMVSARKIELIALTGADCMPPGPHSDFIIDPARLSSLLNELI